MPEETIDMTRYVALVETLQVPPRGATTLYLLLVGIQQSLGAIQLTGQEQS